MLRLSIIETSYSHPWIPGYQRKLKNVGLSNLPMATGRANFSEVERVRTDYATVIRTAILEGGADERMNLPM
jgi:hypothetical protein